MKKNEGRTVMKKNNGRTVMRIRGDDHYEKTSGGPL